MSGGSDAFRMPLYVLLELRRQWRVPRRDRVVGCALKHGQVLGLRGDHGRGLNAGRAGANHAHALAGEVHPVMRPLASVVPVSLETLQTGEVRHVRRGQAAHRGDQELDDIGFALLRPNAPAVRGFVVMR